jgi:hypothetical protein
MMNQNRSLVMAMKDDDFVFSELPSKAAPDLKEDLEQKTNSFLRELSPEQKAAFREIDDLSLSIQGQETFNVAAFFRALLGKETGLVEVTA